MVGNCANRQRTFLKFFQFMMFCIYATVADYFEVFDRDPYNQIFDKVDSGYAFYEGFMVHMLQESPS